MPVRRWLARRLFSLVEEPLRDYLSARLAADEPRAELERRVTALQAELEALRDQRADGSVDKRLSMAMGAIQAAGTQIVQLRQDVERAANLARQASQQATSAFAMAESAADGVHDLDVLKANH